MRLIEVTKIRDRTVWYKLTNDKASKSVTGCLSVPPELTTKQEAINWLKATLVGYWEEWDAELKAFPERSDLVGSWWDGQKWHRGE